MHCSGGQQKQYNPAELENQCTQIVQPFAENMSGHHVQAAATGMEEAPITSRAVISTVICMEGEGKRASLPEQSGKAGQICYHQR